MEEKNNQCPKCGSHKYKRERYLTAAGPGGSNGRLPSEEERFKYCCTNCGFEKYED